MAIMRKEPKDIAELDPVGIFGETLKLFAAPDKTCVFIQLVLMLPVTIPLLVAEYFIFPQYLPLPSHSINRGSLSPGARCLLDLKGQVEVLLVSSAISLVFQVAVSLYLSTTLYIVGRHYIGQPVSFVDAVRAAANRLWMRLSLTTVYVVVLMDSISLLQTVAMVWSTIAVSILLWVANFGFGILLVISSALSVLGEDYGWAAMKEGA